MSENIINVTDDSFAVDVLQSNLPVLVDFWAPWCGPCRILAPTLEDIADSYKDKVKVLKMNVDDNQTTAAKYGIRGIPTLILYKDGKVVSTKTGGDLSKSKLTTFLDSNI